MRVSGGCVNDVNSGDEDDEGNCYKDEADEDSFNDGDDDNDDDYNNHY